MAAQSFSSVPGFVIDVSTLSSGTTNDLDPGFGGSDGLARWTPSGTATITGIAGGRDGQRITLVNENSSTFTITLAHENSGSVAANRFRCPGNTSLTIRANGGVVLIYAGDRWQAVTP